MTGHPGFCHGAALALMLALAPVRAAEKLSTDARMNSCDPKVAIAAAKEVLADPANLKEPLMLFAPAMVLYQQGQRDEAVFWFYAAQLRARLQLLHEQGDRGQLLQVMMMTGAAINNYAFQDIARFNGTLERVLAWDRKTPNPFADRAKTPEDHKRVESIYKGLDEMKAKLNAEKDEIEPVAREVGVVMQKDALAMELKRCPP